jgi:hypothetical protein
MQDMAKRDHAKRMQSMREWTDDELRMLDKAVKKFPMGTPKRWEQVGAFLCCLASTCAAAAPQAERPSLICM